MGQTKHSLVSRVTNGPSPQQTDLDVGEGRHIKQWATDYARGYKVGITS